MSTLTAERPELVRADDGKIYAGTGPDGGLYEIKKSGSYDLLLDTDENNLMCMTSDVGDLLYVGTDPNGRSRRDPRDSFDHRWRSFPIAEVQARDFKIDGLKWLKDESHDDGEELPYPEDLAADAIAELQGAVGELNEILKILEGEPEIEAPLLLRRAE